MKTRRAERIVVAAAVAGVLLAAAPALSERAADWERQASQWAAETQAKALAAHPDAAEMNLKALNAQRKGLDADLAAASAGKDLIVFQRAYQSFILSTVAPTAAEAKVTALSIAAAADEWEPLTIGVWALKDLDAVSVTVSDLAGPGGKGLPAARCVRVLYGMNLWTPVAKKTVRPPDGDIIAGQKVEFEQTFKETPSALVDSPSMKVGKDNALAVWIDVYVPKDAAAGEYKGEVAVNVGGSPAARLPLTVTVRPFVLDDASEWGRGPFTSKHLDRKQLIQMREHGINMMSWWTSAGYTLKLEGGKIVCDFSPYAKYARLLEECGYLRKGVVFLGASDPKIQNRVLQILGRPQIEKARDNVAAKAFADSDLSEPFGTYLCQAMKQFHATMKEAGWGDFSACLLDEPDHAPRPQRRDWYNKMFAMVEKGAPEVPLYGTYYHAGDEDRLSPHHRIWMTNRPARRIAEKCKAAGKDLWTYGFNTRYWETPRDNRFRLGIQPWVFGATGSFLWANYWHDGEPFDPWTMKNTDTFSLPTPAGPLATPMLKGFREGVDDRRYISTLERLIAKARQAGGAAAAAAAADEQFLDAFRKPLFEKMTVTGGRPSLAAVGRIEVKGTDGSVGVLEGGEAGTWQFAEFVRADVARRIAALQALLK